MASQPEQLRRGEARQRTVPGQRDEAFETDALLDLGALGLGPLVVPEDRGPEDVPPVVEADESVHLTGETDLQRLDPQRVERLLRGAPPVLRILLRPAG